MTNTLLILEALRASPEGNTIPELIQILTGQVSDGNIRFGIRDMLAKGQVKKSGAKRGEGNKAVVYLPVEDPQEQQQRSRLENARRLAKTPAQSRSVTVPALAEDQVLTTDRTRLDQGIRQALAELVGLEFQPHHQVRIQVEAARKNLTTLFGKAVK